MADNRCNLPCAGGADNSDCCSSQSIVRFTTEHNLQRNPVYHPRLKHIPTLHRKAVDPQLGEDLQRLLEGIAYPATLDTCTSEPEVS